MTNLSFCSWFARPLGAIVCVLACGCGTRTARDPAPVEAYIDELRQDVQRQGAAYNSTVACYVDLTRPDNSYRFFVLDLARRKVLLRGVCLNGLTDKQGRVRYSNEVNSNCSSRGLARIGERYRGGALAARFACTAWKLVPATCGGGQWCCTPGPECRPNRAMSTPFRVRVAPP